MRYRILTALIVAVLATPAIAQQPAAKDPTLDATEQILMGEITAHRNYMAQTSALNSVVQAMQKQHADDQAKIADLQKDLEAAKTEKAATSKALPAPRPAK